jgi:hypothetical protein
VLSVMRCEMRDVRPLSDVEHQKRTLSQAVAVDRTRLRPATTVVLGRTGLVMEMLFI